MLALFVGVFGYGLLFCTRRLLDLRDCSFVTRPSLVAGILSRIQFCVEFAEAFKLKLSLI